MGHRPAVLNSLVNCNRLYYDYKASLQNTEYRIWALVALEEQGGETLSSGFPREQLTALLGHYPDD